MPMRFPAWLRLSVRVALASAAALTMTFWSNAALNRYSTVNVHPIWLKMSPDGSLVTAARSDGSVAVFNGKTGKELRLLGKFHGTSTRPVSYGESSLFFFQFAARRHGLRFALSEFPGLRALFPDAAPLVRETAVVDPDRQRLLFRNVAVSRIDELPVLADSDHFYALLKIDHQTGKQSFQTFSTNEPNRPRMEFELSARISGPSFSSDGRLVCGWLEDDARLLLFDLPSRSSHPITALLPGDIASSAWAISKDANLLVLGRRTGHVELWDLSALARMAVFGPLCSIPERIEIASDNSSFVCAAQDGELIFCDIPTASLRFSASLEGNSPVDLRILTQIDRLAALDRSNTLRWWRISDQRSEPLGVVRTMPGDAVPLELSHSGFALIANDQGLAVIDLAGGATEPIQTIPSESKTVTSVSVAKLADRFAVIANSCVEIRDLRRGDLLAVCDAPETRQAEFFAWLAWTAPAAALASSGFIWIAWGLRQRQAVRRIA